MGTVVSYTVIGISKIKLAFRKRKMNLLCKLLICLCKFVLSNYSMLGNILSIKHIGEHSEVPALLEFVI